MGSFATFRTCCRTLSSIRASSFYSQLPTKVPLNLHLSSRRWLSQASKAPKSFWLKAALTPPHPQCPVTKIFSTFRCSTAYWTADTELMSEGGTRLAMFRCTKTSPGFNPMIQLAGTLESAHPIHRYLGVWMWVSLEKKSGSFSTHSAAHFLLFSTMTLKFSLSEALFLGLSSFFMCQCLFSMIQEIDKYVKIHEF